MFLCYSLRDNISVEKLAKDLQNLINKFVQTNPDLSNSMVKITIATVSQETNDLVPKLEHKNI